MKDHTNSVSCKFNQYEDIPNFKPQWGMKHHPVSKDHHCALWLNIYYHPGKHLTSRFPLSLKKKICLSTIVKSIDAKYNKYFQIYILHTETWKILHYEFKAIEWISSNVKRE